MPLQHSDPQIGDRNPLQRLRLRARKNGVEDRTTLNRGSNRTHRIKARRERKDTRHRYPASSRLEPRKSAQRRRHTDRAASVRTDSGHSHAIGHRDSSSRSGPAGNPGTVSIKRIARRAIVRIDSQRGERKLRHVGAPHQDRPSLDAAARQQSNRPQQAPHLPTPQTLQESVRRQRRRDP